MQTSCCLHIHSFPDLCTLLLSTAHYQTHVIEVTSDFLDKKLNGLVAVLSLLNFLRYLRIQVILWSFVIPYICSPLPLTEAPLPLPVPGTWLFSGSLFWIPLAFHTHLCWSSSSLRGCAGNFRSLFLTQTFIPSFSPRYNINPAFPKGQLGYFLAPELLLKFTRAISNFPLLPCLPPPRLT